MSADPTLVSILSLLQSLEQRIIRIENKLAPSGQNPDYEIIRHPTDRNLYQLAGTKRYRADFWFTSNLFYPYAETDAQRAFIQLNVGTDSNGTLKPMFGHMFAQANSANDDGITGLTSPDVHAVMQDETGNWVLNYAAPYRSPPGANYRIYYAARLKTLDQLIEWTRRTAIELDNPNFGSGNFSPSPSGG